MPNERASKPSRHEQPPYQPGDRGFQGAIAQARIQRPAPMYLGHCVATRRVQAEIQRAVHANAAVLLIGARGTGKRTIAEILHHFCGGEIPVLQTVDLGRVEQIERIVDFAYLSPIEQLSVEQQGRLFNEVGLARVIVATRLDPDSAEGRARLSRQLLRTCSIRIELPSLCERIEDLEALALKIISEIPSRRPIGGISDCALDCLRAHDWPGNVTQLERVLRRAVEVGTTEQIELCDLPPALRLRDVDTLVLDSPDDQFSLAYAERSAVERAMRFARGNKRKAARLLQIGKTTLYRKLRDYHAEADGDAEDGHTEVDEP